MIYQLQKRENGWNKNSINSNISMLLSTAVVNFDLATIFQPRLDLLTIGHEIFLSSCSFEIENIVINKIIQVIPKNQVNN
jgi:hypothetical protein